MSKLVIIVRTNKRSNSTWSSPFTHVKFQKETHCFCMCRNPVIMKKPSSKLLPWLFPSFSAVESILFRDVKYSQFPCSSENTMLMKICTKHFPESKKLVKSVEVNYCPLSVTIWHAFLLLLNTSLMLERYRLGNISQLWRSSCMYKMCLIIYYNNFSRFLDGHRLLSLLMCGEVLWKNNGQNYSIYQHKPCEICDMIKS